MYRLISILLIFAACFGSSAGRTTSTRSMAEQLMRDNPPRCQYDTTITTPADFAGWRTSVKEAMERIMRHPDYRPEPPRMVATVRREGYIVQKWESYPLPGAVVPMLLLIPDGVDQSNPAPAVLCVPGFGQTKEMMAGEPEGNFDLSKPADSAPNRNAQALMMVREGLVTLAVDNPSCGELSDNGHADYVDSSRFLLEVGWSYLGLASWQDRVALDWLKQLPIVKADRVLVSGFSLGTEPLMVLGVLDDSIYGFIYNDFLCRTRERALVMNKPDDKGARPFPNNTEHLIPEFLTEFDFPDLVAALAPRPVICTEGGMDRDFLIIRTAYEAAGCPDAFEYHHYAKYADPAVRAQLSALPSGIDRKEFFRLVNCDSPNHYYKAEHILPWIRQLLSD